MSDREKAICYVCGKEVEMPFRCNYCNLTFCDEHRLPESHNCINLPDREWFAYKKMKEARLETPKQSNWRRYAIVIGAIIIVFILVYYVLFS